MASVWVSPPRWCSRLLAGRCIGVSPLGSCFIRFIKPRTPRRHLLVVADRAEKQEKDRGDKRERKQTPPRLLDGSSAAPPIARTSSHATRPSALASHNHRTHICNSLAHTHTHTQSHIQCHCYSLSHWLLCRPFSFRSRPNGALPQSRNSTRSADRPIRHSTPPVSHFQGTPLESRHSRCSQSSRVSRVELTSERDATTPPLH